MRVFLGSSTESMHDLKLIASWLSKGDEKHTTIPWTDATAFRENRDLFPELLRAARTSDGAIFIFGEDDYLISREARLASVRDNVLLEYGLFVGSLGRDSVRCVIVGDPKLPSDMLGVVTTRLPKGNRRDGRWQKAKKELTDWARSLSPSYVTGLGFGLAKAFMSMQTEHVSDLLGPTARRLLSNYMENDIRALCSNKGENGPAYYKAQFDWVRSSKKSGRSLKRVFVRSRNLSGSSGFTEEEVSGILSHLDQDHPEIQAKWIYDDDEALRRAHSDDLGFCLFGAQWIVHWGTLFGASSDERESGIYLGIGSVLSCLFEDVWRGAKKFDSELIDKLKQ